MRVRRLLPLLTAAILAVAPPVFGQSQAMHNVAVHLGSAVANITAVLDPALIVFGGGISHVGEQLFAPIRQVVVRIVPNVPEIRLTAVGDDAQLFGSLYTALQIADARLFDSL